MKTIKSHSLDQGSASVDGAVLDENTSDDGANAYWAVEGSQIDGRRGSRATIRSADVEYARDRMMNLKARRNLTNKKLQSIIGEIKSTHLVNNPFFNSRLKISIFRINFLLILTSFQLQKKRRKKKKLNY